MNEFPIRVLHPITRMIVGGAQENTMYTAARLDPARYAVEVVSGPQTGSEGSLIDEARRRGVTLTICPPLLRQVSPLNDLRALAWLTGSIRRGRFDIVHTHSSKAGILGLTRTLARELGPRNIRVNALVPGAIVTERQTTLHRDPAADKEFLDAQCLKIRLDPGHVARATLFLAADDSDGMTGQHVLVDAGIAQNSVVT